MIESVFKRGEDYYLQVFLVECKYIVKEKKLIRYISDDLEISSDDSDKDLKILVEYRKNYSKMYKNLFFRDFCVTIKKFSNLFYCPRLVNISIFLFLSDYKKFRGYYFVLKIQKKKKRKEKKRDLFL